MEARRLRSMLGGIVVVYMVCVGGVEKAEARGRAQYSMQEREEAKEISQCLKLVGKAVDSSCHVSRFGTVSDPSAGCCERVGAAIAANPCCASLHLHPYANTILANTLRGCHLL